MSNAAERFPGALAVLAKCWNHAELNANKFGGDVLRDHAESVHESIVAIEELIEAVTEGCPDSFGQILFDEYGAERLNKALARVRGEA